MLVSHVSLLFAFLDQKQLMSHAILIFARSDVIWKIGFIPPNAYQVCLETEEVCSVYSVFNISFTFPYLHLLNTTCPVCYWLVYGSYLPEKMLLDCGAYGCMIF